MFCYDVFDEDRIIGRASVSREGLYWSVRVLCQTIPDRITRVIVEKENQQLRLGTLLPCAQGSILEKRISDRTFHFTDECCFKTDADDGWDEFTGDLCGCRFSNCRKKQTPLGFTIAWCYAPDAPIPMMELMCFFRLERYRGKLYWMIDFDQKDQPIIKTATES